MKEMKKKSNELLQRAKKVEIWNTAVLSLVLVSCSFMIWKGFHILYAKTERDVKQLLRKQNKLVLSSSIINFLASIMFMEYMLRFKFLSAAGFEVVVLSFNIVFSFVILIWAISLNLGKLEWCVNKAIATIHSVLLFYMTQVLVIAIFLGRRWSLIMNKV